MRPWPSPSPDRTPSTRWSATCGRRSCRRVWPALTASGWPLVLSLWFLYRDGALWCASRPQARVVHHLERDGRCAFEVARDAPPYRGVRGQARASVIRGEGGRLLGELIDRYLGARDSRLARRLLGGAADEVAIRIVPTRLASWDYTERMRVG